MASLRPADTAQQYVHNMIRVNGYDADVHLQHVYNACVRLTLYATRKCFVRCMTHPAGAAVRTSDFKRYRLIVITPTFQLHDLSVAIYLILGGHTSLNRGRVQTFTACVEHAFQMLYMTQYFGGGDRISISSIVIINRQVYAIRGVEFSRTVDN